jgi:oxygen-independent coproporphyrinogen-3 oxidase
MDRIDQAAWRDALLRELDHGAGEAEGRVVSSIFFGGGTPSLMPPATTAALIERVAQRWRLAPDLEITLEANPGSVDAERFAGFRAAGVNRLSIGLQSLEDDQLRWLGRRHDSAQAIAAVELGRRLFPRLSFDLIYARPGQTPAAWRRELGRALALAADHLSLYQLTIEAGTAFQPMAARGDFILPDDDQAADLFELTQELTAAAGLPAYEISNHARPGAECRHNLLYWQGDDWLGVGPGAHGRLTGADGVTRGHRRHRAPEIWLQRVRQQGQGTAARITLSGPERVAELVMMGLRLTEGLSAAAFARRCGQPLLAVLDGDGLADMLTEGFLRWQNERLQASPAGRLLLNRVIAALLPDSPA